MLLALLPVALAWNPDAGVIPSLTDGAAPFGTGNAAALPNILDGDVNTHWQSDACYPTGWLSRPDLDVALGLCATAGACSGPSGNLSLLTDGNTRSGSVDLAAGTTLRLALTSASPLRRLRLHGTWAEPLWITATRSDGSVLSLDRVAPSADANTAVNVDVPGVADGSGRLEEVVSVSIVSDGAVRLGEVGVLNAICFVNAGVDFGAPTEVGWVRMRHWAGSGGTATHLIASDDGVTWTTLAELDPESLAYADTVLARPITTRFLGVRQDIVDGDWKKAYLWEIDAYDAVGPFGLAPAPVANPVTFGDLLGVNGIWGWGSSGFSDSAPAGEGPDRFAFFGHARNYHNLGWDVRDPDTVPDYDAMAAGAGTDAMWWLDWDREYGAWHDRGIEDIDTSIQFTAAGGFPVASFDDPYAAGFGYAQSFARHFGPTSGTGTVTAMEAGNEPWDYPAAFYASWLEGFAAGARSGDPAMRVTAGAFQAGTPEDADATSGHYMGARVTEAAAANLDAVNAHAYSFMYDEAGTRLGVMPEHPQSSMREVFAALRWRDANLPGKPVWLTEWGWDSEGGGETCTGTECVSEAAQADYLVRGAMIGARWGLSRMDWYFYANVSGASGLFGRSGLVASSAGGFAEKRSHRAMQALLVTLGDRRFLRVLREDDEVWAYVLGDADGVATHLIAWAPVLGGNDVPREVALDLDATPIGAWTLDGQAPVGEAADLPAVTDGTWTLPLTATPLVVAFTPREDVDTGDTASGDTADTGSVDSGSGSDTAGGEGASDLTKDPGGCGCAGTPTRASPWRLLTVVLAAAWTRSRRRRQPSSSASTLP